MCLGTVIENHVVYTICLILVKGRGEILPGLATCQLEEIYCRQTITPDFN